MNFSQLTVFANSSSGTQESKSGGRYAFFFPMQYLPMLRLLVLTQVVHSIPQTAPILARPPWPP